MTTPADDWTLGQARAWLREHVDDGATCPLCTQFAKVYQRKINAGIARGLIHLYCTYNTEWANLHSAVGHISNHVASAEWWGLLEESTDRRDDGGRGKEWRLTDEGVKYVRCLTTVPKYARVYNGRVLNLTGEPQTILDAIGDKFDYRELMGE